MDLYYALFGSKVPNCLVKAEQTMTMGLPKIPKLSDAKRAQSPFDNHIEAVDDKRGLVERENAGIKRQFESINNHSDNKDEPNDNDKVMFDECQGFF